MGRDPEPHGFPQRRHFGRRKGPPLSAHQNRLFEQLLPQLLIEPELGRDPRGYFSSDFSEVWLEIGFGGGEHLLWQAQTHPLVGIIGAEPYVSGVAKLLSKLVPLGSSAIAPDAPAARSNIRLYMEDAADIIEALPAASVGWVFVLFPDPWPKTRHHKRRFIQTPMLNELARVMKPGAELRFATDDQDYLVWTLERLCAHPAFVWLASSPTEWRTRPQDWPETRYEAKAKGAGVTCTYLRFMRN